MAESPIATAAYRDNRGRFARGNQLSRGNSAVNRRQRLLRAALSRAVSVDDIKAIAQALVAKARAGDALAAREIFDRLLGRNTVELFTDDLEHAAAEFDLSALTVDELEQLQNLRLKMLTTSPTRPSFEE